MAAEFGSLGEAILKISVDINEASRGLRKLLGELDVYAGKIANTAASSIDVIKEVDQSIENISKITKKGSEKVGTEVIKTVSTFKKLENAASRVRSRIVYALKEASVYVKQFNVFLGEASHSLFSLGMQAGMLSAALGAMLIPALNKGMEFEKTMSAIKAVVSELQSGTEEASQWLNNLSELAKKLGADTKFSAQEVAEAMKFLGVAGFTAQEIYDGVNATLSLAAAGMLDLDVAAGIAADTMIAFGISATQLGRVADNLAAVAMNANTTVQLLGESMKYVSPIASTLGQSLEEVVISLGLLARAGLKGSIAGASLSQVLSQLTAKSDKLNETLRKYGLTFADVNPEVVKLTDIIRTFRVVGLQSIDAMELFMVRAGRALTTMMNAGAEATQKLTEEIEGSFGAALIAAGIRVKNVAGTLEQFFGAIESLSITIFQQINVNLTETLNKLIDILVEVRFWIEANDVVAQQVIKITAYTAVLVATVAAISMPLAALTGSLSIVIDKFVVLGGWLSDAPNIIKGFAASVIALPIAFGKAISSTSLYTSIITTLNNVLLSFIGVLARAGKRLVWFSTLFSTMPMAGYATALHGIEVALGNLAIRLKTTGAAFVAFNSSILTSFVTSINRTVMAVYKLFNALAIIAWNSAIAGSLAFDAALMGLISSIGKILPKLTSLSGILSVLSGAAQGFVSILAKFAGYISFIGTSISKLLHPMGAFRQSLLGVITAVGAFITTLGGLPGLVAIIIGATGLGAVIGILITLKANWDKFVNALKSAYDATIKPVIEGFMAAVLYMWKNALKPVWDVLVAAVGTLLNKFTTLFKIIGKGKIIFQVLGAIIGGILMGAIVAVVAVIVGFVSIFNGFIDGLVWASDIVIELGRKLGILGEGFKTSKERAKENRIEVEKLRKSSKDLLDTTKKLDEERKKKISQDRVLIDMIKAEQKGSNTLAQTEEMIKRMRATGAKSTREWALSIKLSNAAIEGEIQRVKQSLKALKDFNDVSKETKKVKEDLELRLEQLNYELKANKTVYRELISMKNISIEQMEKEYKRTKEATEAINSYNKSLQESGNIEKDLGNKRENLQLKYLEGTEKELAQIQKLKEENLKAVDSAILLQKSMIDARKISIRIKEEMIKSGEIPKWDVETTQKMIEKWGENIKEAEGKIIKLREDRIAFEKDAEKQVEILLEKEKKARERYFLEQQKIEAERNKDYKKAAEIEIQLLERNFEEKMKSLRLTKEMAKVDEEVARQRSEAVRLLAEKEVAVREEAEKKIADLKEKAEGEKKKKDKERDFGARIEEKAADQIARQVRSVRDLFVLYNALYTIRLKQEQIAAKAAEKALKAQQRVIDLREKALKQPENKALKRNLERVELEARFVTAIAKKRLDMAKLPIFDDLKVVTARTVIVGPLESNKRSEEVVDTLRQVLEKFVSVGRNIKGAETQRVSVIEINPRIKEQGFKGITHPVQSIAPITQPNAQDVSEVKADIRQISKIIVNAMDIAVKRGIISVNQLMQIGEKAIATREEKRERAGLPKESLPEDIKDLIREEAKFRSERAIHAKKEIEKVVAEEQAERLNLINIVEKNSEVVEKTTNEIEALKDKITKLNKEIDTPLMEKIGEKFKEAEKKIEGFVNKENEIGKNIRKTYLERSRIEEKIPQLSDERKEIIQKLKRAQLGLVIEKRFLESFKSKGSVEDTETKIQLRNSVIEAKRKVDLLEAEKNKIEEEIENVKQARLVISKQLASLNQDFVEMGLKVREAKASFDDMKVGADASRFVEKIKELEITTEQLIMAQKKLKVELIEEQKSKNTLNQAIALQLKNVPEERLRKIPGFEDVSKMVEEARSVVTLIETRLRKVPKEEKVEIRKELENALNNLANAEEKLDKILITALDLFKKELGEKTLIVSKSEKESQVISEGRKQFLEWKKSRKKEQPKDLNVLVTKNREERELESKARRERFEKWRESKQPLTFSDAIKEIAVLLERYPQKGKEPTKEFNVRFLEAMEIFNSKLKEEKALAVEKGIKEPSLVDVLNLIKKELIEGVRSGRIKETINPQQEKLESSTQTTETTSVDFIPSTTKQVEGQEKITLASVLLDKDILDQRLADARRSVQQLGKDVNRELNQIQESFSEAPINWVIAFINTWREKSPDMINAVRDTMEEIKRLQRPETPGSPSLIDVWKMNTNVVQEGVARMSQLFQKNIPLLNQMNLGNVTPPKVMPMSTAGMQPIQRISNLNDNRSVDMTINNNTDVINLQRQVGNALARAAMNVGQM